MSVLEQIKALDEQKAKLLDDAKAEALSAAEKAIATLNELGFNYKIVEGGSTAAPTGGKRRTGVRQEVLDKVNASPQGITRSDLLEAMDVKGDKSGEQSVSNALANLKKAGKIDLVDGLYKPEGAA